MEAQKSGYAYSVREGEASRSPLRKRSLSLRRFRSPPSNGGAADQSYTAAPSAKREQTAESVPPLPASTSASGRLEGGEASQTAQRKPLAKPRQTAAAGSTRTTHPPLPPAWPKEIKYQRCYCEEGAYLLAAQLELDLAARRSREGEAGEDESSKWEWEVWVVVVSNRDKTVLLWQQKASKSPELNHAVLWDYHVFVVVSRRRMPTKEGESASDAAMGQATAAQSASSPPRPSSNRLAAPLPPRRTRSLFGRSKENTASGGQTASQPSRSQDSTPDWSAWVYDIDSCLCSGPDVPATASTLRPVPLQTYVTKTFAYSPGVYPAEYLPMFRLARAGAFLDNFASDRSHMLSPGSSSSSGSNGGSATGVTQAPEYSSPVPPWPLIVGPRARRKGWGNNLMEKWVNMDDGRQRAVKAGGIEWQNQSEELKIQFGKVLLREEFFAGSWEMAVWRRRTGGKRAELGPSNASWELTSKLGPGSSRSPPIEARTGGRVSSPLFPAYMAASLQARAARPRDSYLALRATDGEGKQLWPRANGQQTGGGQL